MVREKMKHNGGKFFLTIKSRFGIQYYQASGVFDVGTPEEEPYLTWTKYQEYAHGFSTVKSARAMAAKLWEERAIRVRIVNREGAVI
ncbi:MAG: hypothetical protein IJH25_08430 [Clostridia bacterium]|nr:hypothetical protein [Clostridia bacterium]MBQ6121552.1 hypothetical protein [Clostridia bacterium]